MTFTHRHLLDIERLTTDEISTILNRAEHFATQNASTKRSSGELVGKTIINLFFEPSTRTRTSFEIAAQRLGASAVSIPIEHSSAKKGETLLDTVLNLDAMQIDAMVIRHPENGVPHFLAPQTKASIINAGDGTNEHPTQALVDAFILRHQVKDLKNVTLAICGDISHSRVARSNIQLLSKFGATIRTVAPSYFATTAYEKMGVKNFDDMKAGLDGVDAVMMLRIQHERLMSGEFAVSLKDYHQRYGLDAKKLAVAKPNVIVMHPGPINREVEITSSLADDPTYSVIRKQVEAGVAVRMAVLDLLLNK